MGTTRMHAARHAYRGLCGSRSAETLPHKLQAGLALATGGLIGAFVGKDQADKAKAAANAADNAGKLSPEQEAERQQFYDDCYDSNHPLGCHRLAEYMYYYDTNYEKAEEIWSDNCDRRGHAESCFNVGTMYQQGMGAVFSKAHENKTGIMTVVAASEANNTKPEIVFDGRQRAVKWLGSSHVGEVPQGQDDSDRQHPAAAATPIAPPIGSPLPVVVRSVDASVGGVVELSNGSRFENPEAVPRSFAKACQAFAKACDKGFSRGCYNLAAGYAQGLGVKKDVAKARELYDQACDGGFGDGCLRLATAYLHGHQVLEVKRDAKKALGLLEKACALDKTMACQNLVVMYKHGDGVEKSDDLANKYQRRYHQIIREAKQKADASKTSEA